MSGSTFFSFLKNNFPELFRQNRKMRRQEKQSMEHGIIHREKTQVSVREMSHPNSLGFASGLPSGLTVTFLWQDPRQGLPQDIFLFCHNLTKPPLLAFLAHHSGNSTSQSSREPEVLGKWDKKGHANRHPSRFFSDVLFM